jgi:hypothetical protein
MIHIKNVAIKSFVLLSFCLAVGYLALVAEVDWSVATSLRRCVSIFLTTCSSVSARPRLYIHLAGCAYRHTDDGMTVFSKEGRNPNWITLTCSSVMRKMLAENCCAPNAFNSLVTIVKLLNRLWQNNDPPYSW